MGEFVVVGSSLLEEKLMKFFDERIKTKKVNKINAFIMKINEYKFDLTSKLQKDESNGEQLVVPKCKIEEEIEIPFDQILLSRKDSFGVVSTGELFNHICQFLRSDQRMNNYKDEFGIILISGLYFSKHLSLIICIPNTIIKEMEIHNFSELNFRQMIQKDSKKSSKYVKLFNYSSNVCKIKPSTQSIRCPYQYKDTVFKIKSLTLSSSSYDTIGLFMEKQLTCIKIIIDIIPIKQRFRDITSVLTTPSFYLFNLQNNHNLLINWSPDQSCTKINRVLYTSLLVSFLKYPPF
ncbi:uncharacterized protein cubi_00044 [Cryptosporidium ubiquitum]|uniref:Uncharacterized protein n=1 Tax=Cryptosporidium ubiquitum TaxID=857276 RepID=A0A1J4MM06_9CRYT|nr:uncharacterized protein cubi_00044 [Cryptosporidium ubiquitum]OII74491.1 hypothetical protein cubi_00044 [Cryptosporidium ubiquitum]